MNIKELTGNAIKKALGIKKCMYRWHNKNNGGGNFGINLYDVNGANYEITGYYNVNGDIYSLSFGRIYQAGTKIGPMKFDALMEFIKNTTLKIAC